MLSQELVKNIQALLVSLAKEAHVLKPETVTTVSILLGEINRASNPNTADNPTNTLPGDEQDPDDSEDGTICCGCEKPEGECECCDDCGQAPCKCEEENDDDYDYDEDENDNECTSACCRP